MRVMQSQAKKCLEPPQARKGKERFFYRDFRRSMDLDFRLLSAITFRESISFVFSHQAYGVFHGSPERLIQRESKGRVVKQRELKVQRL